MIFDTHAHYDDEQFAEDREQILASLFAGNVGAVVDVSAELDSAERVLELAGKYPQMYAAVGVHPDDVGEMSAERLAQIERLCAHEKCVAVGEIGLDYHWMVADKKTQAQWFAAQIELAKRVKKPVIIHSRDAAEDTLNIVRGERAYEAGGVMHCYSYSREMAAAYIDMGFYIGVGGVLTFKNARKLREVVEYAPMDRIVVETDCPYLAPEPFRGKRNCSAYIAYVLDELARIKGISREEAERITWENAQRMFFKGGL